MAECAVCHRRSRTIGAVPGLCVSCILQDAPAARRIVHEAHAQSRRAWRLPAEPPRGADGKVCDRCVNACAIARNRTGYCGIRRREGEELTGGDVGGAAVQWYDDPLPTNCVADWVCPAAGSAGFGVFTDTRGPERGYFNLAVFYEACSFDCLFCQNWHFRRHSLHGPRHSSAELAAAVGPRTRCICFFGGDPSCQVEHALAAAQQARRKHKGRILRVCWETNGSVSRPYLDRMAELSLESGGCIKFDLKAWDEPLHRALCGAGNRQTLDNFEHLSSRIKARPDPPFLIASTLLVPGYVEAEQVSRLAQFIARLDATIPYALLAFHPCFEMSDLPPTSAQQAGECFRAAKEAGLARVRLGNIHLLA